MAYGLFDVREEGRLKAFVNGKIYVSFKPLRIVSAIFVANGRVVYAGSDEVAIKLAELLGAEVVDLEGKTVLPGFVDSHIHLDELGIYLNSLDLRDVGSIEELKKRLREFAKDVKTEWIIGYGWDQEKLGRYPTRWDLDEVVSDRPVILSRFCLHAGVLNTKALKLCNIDTESPYVLKDDRGIIGVVVEREYERSMNVFRKSLTLEDYKILMEIAQDHLLNLGVTAVGFMNCSRIAFEALDTLRIEGKLKIRVAVYFKDQMDFVSKRFGDEFLRINGLKVIVDGSLGARTAWLSEPYEDAETVGLRLIEKINTPPNAQIAAHGIGDKAIDLILESLSEGHRLEHASVLRDDQLKKLEKKKIMVSVQPRFIHDDWWVVSRLGRRSRFVYRIRSLLEKGITVGFGTDAPVGSANPWDTVYSAVTRGKYEGLELFKYTADECVSVKDALHCYTSGSSKLLLWDDIGSLEAGKLADFIVVSRDPFGVREKEIKNIKVLKTYVGGYLVN